ncbi:SMC-Scp complex subunit ScpB [Ensifer soli]|uniref:SMC-Scp complex subunit ScpB n=1 Tax=Ciceribacter sp. sgz301302 TaxID=3342379 RepID=UPI0035BB3AA9
MTGEAGQGRFAAFDDAEEARAAAADARRLAEATRIAEALVFASAMPVSEAAIATHLPAGISARKVLLTLKAFYAPRGVNLVQVADHWAFRTAADLAFSLGRDDGEVRKLSRAALEVLSIIAYHQPVTRAEIEDIRGVQTSKGTLDVLMEEGWVRFRGRRRTPGRPVTFGTTRAFLDHFGLEDLRDLPGIEELKAAGLLAGRIPAAFHVPIPADHDDFEADEDPIRRADLEELGLLTPMGEEAEEKS